MDLKIKGIEGQPQPYKADLIPNSVIEEAVDIANHFIYHWDSERPNGRRHGVGYTFEDGDGQALVYRTEAGTLVIDFRDP